MPGNSLIGNLAVNLTLETAAFQRGANIAEKRAEAMRSRFAAAGKSVAGLGAALGVGIGIAALTNVARGAFEMASALSESAEKVGVSVEALQELRFAAQQTGVSEEQLAVALTRLNKSMGELALGKKGAVDAFAAIGLAADDLKGKAPEEALRIIADALNKLPDVQQRVAIGSQIMGKSFSQLLPLLNGGSKALDSYSEAARKSGIITTEEAKQLDDMSDSWERAKLKITVATAKIIAWFDSLEKGVIQWYAFRDKVVGAVGDMVSGIASALTNRLNAVWNSVTKKIDYIGNKFKWLYDVVVGHSYVPDMVDEIGAQMARLDALMVDPAISATAKTAESFRALQESTKGLLDRLFPEASALNQLKAEMATLEAAMKKGILTADQYAAALNRLQTEGLSDAPLDVLDQGSIVPESFNLQDIAAQLDKIMPKMDGIVQRSQQWQDALADIATNLAGLLSDWLTGFIEGTAKLKDLWKALLGFAIQTFLSPNGPFAAAVSGARAKGGPVARGKTYLVGEEGPELFSPGSSGRIIPNDRLGVTPSARGSVSLNFYGLTDVGGFHRNERQIARNTNRALARA